MFEALKLVKSLWLSSVFESNFNPDVQQKVFFRHTLGSKFRSIRLLKGYKEDYVAQKLGMSQNNYSKYELDKIRPTWDFIEKFAEVHEVDPIKVVSWEDEFIFNNHQQQGGNAANIIFDQKHEQLLEAKDEVIRVLGETIKSKDQTIGLLLEKITPPSDQK